MELKEVLLLALGSSGLVGLMVTLRQLAAVRRAHLFQVYVEMMNLLDHHEIREARHYVYNHMNRDTYLTEKWLSAPGPDGSPSNSSPQENKGRAEKVARAFDRLGFLVRDGRVPVNLIAHFYAYPTLMCWYKLAPYIRGVRGQKGLLGRGQSGHMWSFEHLAVDIVLRGLKRDSGIWKGVRDHDDLSRLMKLIEEDRSPGSGTSFNPSDDLWVIGKWWQLWRL